MTFRIGLFAGPAVVAIGAVLLLNWLNATPAIAAVVLGLVAVSGGSFFGYFANRLPEIRRPRRAPRLIPHHGD